MIDDHAGSLRGLSVQIFYGKICEACIVYM